MRGEPIALKWKHLPIVAFDTETTGLEPFGGDRIIEFAAVEFRLDSEGRIADERRHAWLVDPGIPIPRKVQRITGISDADVARQPPFEAIADEVSERFGVDRIAIVHRTGEVPLGEVSVAIVAVSPHRDAAFDAARYAIDETKARAPIWKAERFEDGHVWIGKPARTGPTSGPEEGA